MLCPSAVAACAIACSLFMHALALSATVRFVRREKQLGLAGANFWTDVAIVSLAILFALAAHLVDIAVWGMLFIACGEFPEFGTAYYHSAVNYTTLGYGDLIMTPKWRLMGPLEAADGMLMFGVSTAIIFAVIQRLIQVRFVDLRDNRSPLGGSQEVAQSPSVRRSYVTAKKEFTQDAVVSDSLSRLTLATHQGRKAHRNATDRTLP